MLLNTYLFFLKLLLFKLKKQHHNSLYSDIDSSSKKLEINATVSI